MGATTDTYAYSPTANQISTITTGSNVRSFSYLASGQVSQDVRDPSHTYSFAANDNGRNTSASLNGIGVGSYLYNAFEQRVQTASASTTQFVFDRAGHLLEETNGATGAALREYIWLDDLPVAMVDDIGASPVLYFIHTDQLGTPQKITDANASVVWEGLYDPFGNMITITGANWGAGVWGSFDWAQTSPPIAGTNLRFPGQYADAETALNQNWNRDYDPTIGRYVESDPVGLSSGINTYTYSLNQPLIFIDPTGTGYWGGIIGGAIGEFIGQNTGLYYGAAAGTPEEPGGGTLAGGLIGGYEGATEGEEIGSQAGSALEDLILMMAKGGRQNISNEYSREAKLQPDPCAWLKDQYNKSTNSAERQKIKTAQKDLGCRRTGCN